MFADHSAIAGKLTAENIPVVHDLGVNIVGVRGAACSSR
jgi:uncharacterized protein (UPF0264 family)